MTDNIGIKTRNSLYWNLFVKVPYEIIRFGISILIARVLDPKDFGIVSIASIVIYYSNTITNFGFNQALVQRKEITNTHINSVFTIDLTISLVMTTIFYIFAPTISSFFNSPESKDVIRVMSLVFILTALYDLPYNLFRRSLNFKIISLVDITKNFITSLLVLLLAHIGYKYWAIVYGQLVPLFFAAVYLIFKSGWFPRILFQYAPLKELFNFGFWSFVRAQVYFLSTRIDRIIVGKFLDTAILGLYDKAKSLSQMPVESISGNITTVLSSTFSRIQHDNNDDILRIFKKSVIVTSAIIIPICLGLYSVAGPFVRIMLGEKWAPMIIPFQLMCISGIFISLNELFGSILVGLGFYGEYSIRQIIYTILLSITSLVLVWRGIEAVAIGIIFNSVLIFYMNFNIIRKKLNTKWKNLFSWISPILLCSFIMFLAIGVYAYFYDVNRLYNFVLTILIGITIYIISILFIPINNLDIIRIPVKQNMSYYWNKWTLKEGNKNEY